MTPFTWLGASVNARAREDTSTVHTTRKAHLRLVGCSKRSIPIGWAFHLRWRQRAHMTLHIGFEEHAGFGLGGVVGKGRRNP